LLLCRQTKRSINFLFAYKQQFQLTGRRWTTEYILYFGFLSGFGSGLTITKSGTAASRQRWAKL
jgi:hypothetical protein